MNNVTQATRQKIRTYYSGDETETFIRYIRGKVSKRTFQAATGPGDGTGAIQNVSGDARRQLYGKFGGYPETTNLTAQDAPVNNPDKFSRIYGSGPSDSSGGGSGGSSEPEPEVPEPEAPEPSPGPEPTTTATDDSDGGLKSVALAVVAAAILGVVVSG